MRPVPGLEAVLVTREVETPYSGALPAFIAGDYPIRDLYIDLRPLGQWAGVRIIQEEVTGLDLNRRRLSLRGRPDLSFDLLSLNIGSRPDATRIPGAAEHAVGIKPIGSFLPAWESVRQSAVERLQANAEYRLLIAGGGPASIELALAARHRILRDANIGADKAQRLQLVMVSADSKLLSEHNRKVQESVARLLDQHQVELHCNNRVLAFHRNAAELEGGQMISADAMFFATGASMPSWPADCGLQVDDRGFIAVNTCLQSLSHPFVFAAGDAASIAGYPRPKSGVYAVRQGKPLAENLVRFATGRKLRRHIPQSQALALLYTGNRRAIASRAGFFAQGRWVWLWKDHIDQAFLRKFREVPEPDSDLALATGLLERQTLESLRSHRIRCAGCGAKVGGSVLADVLAELPLVSRPDVTAALATAEDAARIQLDGGRVLLQSVDYLPAFTSDPWLFARIASNHCLGDIHAMGAVPHSALAIVAIPFAHNRFMREMLREVMSGCTEVLKQEDTALIGGHSLEGEKLAFGLSVNGFAAADSLLGKAGVKAGDALILSKPVGTGTLLAADMRYRARAGWIQSAYDCMLVSNRAAAAVFLRHGANACTDITGFGVVGHLLEMLTPGKARAALQLESLPILNGAIDCIAGGITSSLQGDNRLAEAAIHDGYRWRQQPLYQLLFDPQTAGGLLASVPAGAVADCLAELRRQGYPAAARIGTVIAVGDSGAAIELA